LANEADGVRKDLRDRGYIVEKARGRGKSTWLVTDPQTGQVVARFPVSPKPGSWEKNLRAGIARYEEGRPAPRSDRLPQPQ
jgi:hypothetical protein